MADDDETEKLKQNFLKACGATGSLEAAKAAAKALGDEPLASVRAKNGGSALHLAAFAGQLNTAQWLVERGVPVTGVDGGGGTPLHAACFAGNLAVCGWLASSGADIKAADGRGARPLHVACLAGREQVVDLLLRRGALKMCKTRDGATPAALARKASQDKCADLVESFKRPARAAAPAPPVVKRPRPAQVPVPRAGPAPPAPPPLGALQAQMLGIQPAAPPPAQPPLAAAVAAVPQVQAPPPTTARLGVTPSQATDSFVPVSAKAQNDTAREHMAQQAMEKMGRRGVAMRVPTWLQPGDRLT